MDKDSVMDKIVQLQERDGLGLDTFHNIFPLCVNREGLSYQLSNNSNRQDLIYPLGSILGAMQYVGPAITTVSTSAIQIQDQWDKYYPYQMKQYDCDNTYELAIQAPDDEDWNVIVEGNFPATNANNDWIGFYTVYRESGSNTLHYIGNAIAYGGWSNASWKSVVKIPAGKRYLFGMAYLTGTTTGREIIRQPSPEGNRPYGDYWAKNPSASVIIKLLTREYHE